MSGEKEKKEPAVINVLIESWGGTEELVVTAKDRRSLNKLLFKDTRGRYRLDMEGEPLLSNLSGPAIIYPDGDEDFFINGHEADVFQIPGIGDFVDLDVSNLSWANAGGYKLDLDMSVCEATCMCDDDNHSWEVVIKFRGADLEITMPIDFSDLVDEADMLANELDMEPVEFFHTLEFGHRLLHDLTNWVPEEGAFSFLTDEAEERVLGTIQRKIDEYVQKTNAKASEASSGAGLGTMVGVGLAAAAAVGVAGMFSKSVVKTKVITEKAEVGA